MINNRQGGRRRGRGGQRGQSLGGNRQDNRQRGNAAQLLEKYKNMARDAQLAGDRVQSEYYLQFADHYFRVLGENRPRFEEQRKRDDSSDDDDNEDETENETVETTQESGDRGGRKPRGNGRDRSDRPDRPERRERSAPRQASSNDDEEDGERIAVEALPPAIGRETDDGDGEVQAKPKRRTRKPRGDSDEADIAPAA